MGLRVFLGFGDLFIAGALLSAPADYILSPFHYRECNRPSPPPPHPVTIASTADTGREEGMWTAEVGTRL